MKISQLRGAQCGLIVFGLIYATAAGAATLTWPGAAPCNTTLQACITAAVSGDIVEIATNSVVAESPTFDKSLTLRPAAGFTPVLGPGQAVWASEANPAGTYVFTIDGITLQGGTITISHGSTGSVTATVSNCVLLSAGGGFDTGILVQAGNVNPPVMGAIFFTITGNQIHVPDCNSGGGQCMAISVQSGNNPAATGTISGNRIVMDGAGQGGGIGLANGNDTLTVDVIGNTISGTNYDWGIELFQFTTGTTNARIINNLITGQNGNVGWPAAIVVDASGGATAATIINNTVARNRNGFLIGGRPDLGATLTGRAANNVIAENFGSGIQIDAGFAGTFSNGYNLVSGNGFDDFTPGPGTATSPPEFVSPGIDFHVMPTSAAVNGGNNADVPGGITTDLDGSPRIVGGVVDIGCYESAAAQRGVEPVPALGTTALVVFCLALVGLGVALLRRPRTA